MKATDKKNKKALKKSQPSLLEVFDKPMISQEKEEKDYKHLLQIAKEKELREANEEQTRRYGRRYGKIIDIQTYEV
jgi:hypothetical protein